MSTQNSYPTERPDLLLDFANSKVLDPRITFTRSSTATYYNNLGVLSTASNNVARFDYDPSTLQPKGLLIEEARTNSLTYSEQFDNAAWTKSNTTITANAIIAPDGTLSADKLVENATLNQHLLFQTYATTSGTTYTYSVYAKAAEWTVFKLQLGGAGPIGNFDLIAQTATTSSGATAATIQSVGNGWFRCTVTGPSNGSSLNYMYKSSASYTGDGTSGIYIWGAQLEAGAFPTSYIPTTTTQVTRSADVAVMTGTNFNSWYNQGEGTVYAEADMYYATSISGAFPRIISISDGTNNNLIDLQSAQYINENFSVFDTTVQQCSINSSQFAANTVGKLIGGYKVNDFQTSANGVLGIADTLGTIPTSLNKMNIGNRQDLLRPMSGHIRKLAYWGTRLPNAQLQALTT